MSKRKLPRRELPYLTTLLDKLPFSKLPTNGVTLRRFMFEIRGRKMSCSLSKLHYFTPSVLSSVGTALSSLFITQLVKQRGPCLVNKETNKETTVTMATCRHVISTNSSSSLRPSCDSFSYSSSPSPFHSLPNSILLHLPLSSTRAFDLLLISASLISRY